MKTSRRAIAAIPGLALVTIGAAMLLAITTFPAPSQDHDPGMAAYPRVLGILAVLLGVLLVIRPGANDDLPSRSQIARLGGVVAGLLGYALVLTVLGFLLATTLFLVGLLLLLGVRRLAVLAVTAPALSLVVYVVFSELLRISLPRAELELLLF